MARDFWSKRFIENDLSDQARFTGVHSSSRDSTSVVETSWTRGLRALRGRRSNRR